MAALERGRTAIESQQLALTSTAEAAAADPKVPDHVVELARLLRARIDGERAWLEALPPRLPDGAYRFADAAP